MQDGPESNHLGYMHDSNLTNPKTSVNANLNLLTLNRNSRT